VAKNELSGNFEDSRVKFPWNPIGVFMKSLDGRLDSCSFLLREAFGLKGFDSSKSGISFALVVISL
jgi:hypothetical protein